MSAICTKRNYCSYKKAKNICMYNVCVNVLNIQVWGCHSLADVERGKHPNRVPKVYIKTPSVEVGST